MADQHILADPHVMGGVACFAGTRIPVATVMGLLAQGLAVDEVLEEYPQLTVEAVLAGLHFAATAVAERQLPLRKPA